MAIFSGVFPENRPISEGVYRMPYTINWSGIVLTLVGLGLVAVAVWVTWRAIGRGWVGGRGRVYQRDTDSFMFWFRLIVLWCACGFAAYLNLSFAPPLFGSGYSLF